MMHVSLLGTRRGPGWSTGWQTPYTGSHRGQARDPVPGGMPLPGNMETQHFKSTSTTLLQGREKKKIKALKQFGKIGSIYILISETQQGFSGLLCPALGKVATTGGFLCHYSGWRNTYN